MEDTNNGGRIGGGRFDILHDELVEEILLRVPCCVSLLRLRCVCRRWLSTIDAPRFRYRHALRSARRPAPLSFSSSDGFCTWPIGQEGRRVRSVWFPSELSLEFCYLSTPSCHGLVCFIRNERVVVCNPTTRELLLLPDLPSKGFTTCLWPLALGFHPPTNKYKVVHLDPTRCGHVLTLGTDPAWRTFELGTGLNYPAERAFCYDGVLYWYLRDHFSQQTKRPLLTFDLGSEVFRVHSAESDVLAQDHPEIEVLLSGESHHHEQLVLDGIRPPLTKVIRLGRGATAVAVAVILVSRTEATLICNDEGLRLYRDFVAEERQAKVYYNQPRTFLISLHSETLVSLKDLFKSVR